MPHFMALHSIPFDEATLVKYAQEEAPKFLEAGVTWIKTHCCFDEAKHFCEWDAPNKGAIEQIFTDLSIPFDGLYEVRIFDVATAKLED
jgi:hypothetical protein